MRPFIETFITLLVIMDPLGTAPVFVSLTHRMERRRRRIAALQSAVAAGALIVAFAVAGRLLLGYLHVSVESLSIAGGLLLLLVALDMVYDIGKRNLPEPVNIALVPMATPLLAGPGAIAAIMVEVQRFPTLAERAMVLLAVLGVVVVISVTLLSASFLIRRVPPSTIHVVSRVLGFLLAGIAIQLMVDAIRVLVRLG